jgi:phage terminase large subunit
MLPKTKKKLKPASVKAIATEPLAFVPNAGGQQEFFDLVPQDKSSIAPGIRWYYLRGGLGSGKSTCGSAFITSRSLLDPESRGLITANTYGQLETSTCVALAEFCAKFGHKLEPSAETVDLTARKIAHNRYCIINDHYYCLVLSAEVFTGKTAKSKEAGRGLQIRSVWFDEGSYAEKSAFNTINTRMGRGDGWLPATGVITSSINKNDPYNFAYDLFDDPDRSEELKKLHYTIPLSTSENTKYLGEDYERSLRASLTPELIKIELEGEYTSVATGKVFPYFDRAKHLAEITLLPNQEIFVSFDFNWSPATAIVGQERTVNGIKSLYIHREFYLKNANTFISSDRVCEYLRSINANDVQVFGDASGNQKTANSNQSNWQIVWDAFRKYGLNAQGRYSKSNPSVIDTINACNALFNQNRLFIDGRCKESIKDLEFLVFKEGSNPPAIDKSNLDRSHIGDTIRYLVYGLYPIAARSRSATTRWSF